MGISKFLFCMIVGAAVARAEVVAESLPEMKVGTIGVETGLSADIWGDKPDAENVLAQIKATGEVTFSDSEKDVLKRILMTDVGGVAALEQRGEEYLEARVKALVAQGMFDEAMNLLNQVPEEKTPDFVKRLKAEVLFVAGRVEEACVEKNMETFGKQEAFMRAVCADILGVPPASALAYEVYRESGENQYPFLNAAGEVLYRGMDVKVPKGDPSVWEMPIMARVWGIDVVKPELTKEHLWTLINQEQVLADVREKAEQTLKQQEKVKADGQVLTHLIQMAEERQAVERALGDKNAR